jgi:TRAP-type mannitol/chloroaromatic compound transport system permease large subunit
MNKLQRQIVEQPKLKRKKLKIDSLVVLVKLSDGTFRQVALGTNGQALVESFLTRLTKDGTIEVSNKKIEGISW